MAKNLKLNIKNTQIAEAINLTGLKSKLAKKKEGEPPADKKAPPSKPVSKGIKPEGEELPKEEAASHQGPFKICFCRFSCRIAHFP